MARGSQGKWEMGLFAMAHRSSRAVRLGAALLAGGLWLGCGTSTPTPPVDGGPAPDGGPAAGTWERRASLPAPRQELAAAVVGDDLYVVGGLVGLAYNTAEVLRYRAAADQWVAVAPYPMPVDHVAAVEFRGELYVMGGNTEPGATSPISDVYAYDPEGDTWKRRTPMPRPRYAAAAAVVGDRIYVGGGLGQNPEEILAYEPGGSGWEIVNGVTLVNRYHVVAGAVGGKIYFIGGRDPLNLSVVEEFDPAGPTVRTRTSMPTARAGHACAVLGGRIYVTGGEDLRGSSGPLFPQLEIYDPALDVWTTAAPLPSPRHGLGAANLGGVIYAVGGAHTRSFGATAVVEAFTPDGS